MCNYLVELCLHSNKWNKWAACVEAQRGSSTIGQTFAPKPPEPLLFLQSNTRHTQISNCLVPVTAIASPGCLSQEASGISDRGQLLDDVGRRRRVLFRVGRAATDRASNLMQLMKCYVSTAGELLAAGARFGLCSRRMSQLDAMLYASCFAERWRRPKSVATSHGRMSWSPVL